MIRTMLRAALLLAAAAGTTFASAAAPLHAQQDPLNRAFDLERQGSYAAAAEAYRGILASRPTDVAALLGLERALQPLNRSAEIVPQAQRAAASAPASAPAHAVLVRAWVFAERPDSARAAAERWAALQPDNEDPWREWGNAALLRRDRAQARTAFSAGRTRLGRPDALAPELAQLAIAEGDFVAATREWLTAVHLVPGFRSMAVAALAPAPERSRDELLRLVARDTAVGARSLEAGLRARWGDPLGGWRALDGHLPSERGEALAVLREFLSQIQNGATPDAKRARGAALEATAARQSPAQANRTRLDAAQAYTEAGDQASARRMLAGVAEDRTAPAQLSAGASTTLVGVLVAEGKMEEAEQRLKELGGSIPGEDEAELRRRIAAGWVRDGKLERAEALVAADSSVDGLAFAGRISLYRGLVGEAVSRLRAAGPYAGTRDEATARASLLALLQPIAEDSLPELGKAFLQLARGDTAEAVERFERVGGELPPDAGGAEMRLLAGRLSAAQGRAADAERLFRAALAAAGDSAAPATAPAASLELARLLVALDRGSEAVPLLEEMILKYPQSALVPQARRLLDEARGAVPRT